MGKPLCLHFIPSLEQGGAERLLVDLTIADDRFQHAIITILSGVHFFTGAVNAPVRSIGGGSRRWTPLLAPIILVRACLALWRLKPQVVVGWLYYGALLAGLGKLFGARVVWSIHVTDLDTTKGHLYTTLARTLCARLSRTAACDVVHYCAHSGRTFHEAMGFDACKTVVVENGVDVAAFRRNEPVGARLPAPMADGGNGRCLVVGCVARFEPQKDHATLLRALADLKARGVRLRCLLAGRGCEPGNRELGALVGGLGLRDEVEALGAIDGIADFYRRIDVLTLSSSYGESMPLVLIEALASGCPVVATDIGSCRQIVGGFGRVVPPQAPVELASAVLEVAALGRDPAWRRAASDHVEQHFSLNRFIDEWNTLVALSRPAAPAAA